MADFGSNFTNAFSAVYGARTQRQQQDIENARNATADAQRAEQFAYVKKQQDRSDAVDTALANAANGGVVKGADHYLVKGNFTNGADAVTAYQQSLNSPTNQPADYTQPAAKAGPIPMQGATAPGFSQDVQGLPMAAPAAANPMPTPTTALPNGAAPVAQAPTPPKMKATQDDLGNWMVAPENQMRDRSQAEMYDAAARTLISKGYAREAMDMRRNASEARKLDIEEGHAAFVKNLDDANKALQTRNPTLINSSLQRTLGALNDAKDGVAYTYAPSPDGKGMVLSTSNESTGLPVSQKPFVDDPATGKSADMQLLDYLKGYESAEAYSNVFTQNVTLANAVHDRQIKDRQDQRQAEENNRQNTLLPYTIEASKANTAQSKAATTLSGKQGALIDSEISATPAGYTPKKWATDNATFNSRVNAAMKVAMENANPDADPNQLAQAANTQALALMPESFQKAYIAQSGGVEHPPEATPATAKPTSAIPAAKPALKPAAPAPLPKEATALRAILDDPRATSGQKFRAMKALNRLILAPDRTKEGKALVGGIPSRYTPAGGD